MKYLYFFISCLLAQPMFAQSALPIIKATSKKVAINDGGYLDKNAWSLSPKARPDIFTADRTRKTKWVTFYTDIDSMRVKVKPGTQYDFIVLLNGKDSCYTRIASAISPETNSRSNIAIHDTIPFTLTAFNAIQVKAVINHTDTLNLHFDIGSFDFRITKAALLKKTSLLSNQPGAWTGKTTPNYKNLDKVLTMQIGPLVWNNPEINPTEITANDMDGRFGWNLFEGKQVEINYDRNLLIIHSRLPKSLKGFNKTKLEFFHSFVCAKGTFEIAHQRYLGSFLLDTGSDQAVVLDSTWANRQHLLNNLAVINSSTLRDPRGVSYETKIVRVPLMKLNRFDLTNIPAYVLGSKNPVRFEINYLGNDILKRFNMILDFKKDVLYLKPNKLTDVKYRIDA